MSGPRERSWHERRLLADLGDAVARGEIAIIEDADSLFAELFDAFPFHARITRIDWQAVPGTRHLEPPAVRDGAESFELTEANAVELRRFWLSVRQQHGIGDDAYVFVLFDNLVSFALELPVRLLSAHLVDVLSLPQHTYVVPADFSWCFHYTFEDDAFFGSRPARPAG